jgi:hypothetical protein
VEIRRWTRRYAFCTCRDGRADADHTVFPIVRFDTEPPLIVFLGRWGFYGYVSFRIIFIIAVDSGVRGGRRNLRAYGGIIFKNRFRRSLMQRCDNSWSGQDMGVGDLRPCRDAMVT